MDNSTASYNPYKIFYGAITPVSFTIYAVILITGAIANGFLLLAIFKDPLRCFSTPTTYFIVNLAISDLLNLIIYLEELSLTSTKYGSISGFPKYAKQINLTLLQIIFNLTFPSVFSLALERCLAIARPLWHRVNITSRVCRIWLAVVWLFTIVYSLTVVFLLGNFIYADVFYESFVLVATLFVYIFAYISIGRQQVAMATGDTSSDRVHRAIREARLKNQSRFLFTVFIVNVVLIVAFLPIIIGPIVIAKLGMENDYKSLINNSNAAVVLNMIDILFFINFAANPFIYCWRLQKYRKTFLAFFGSRR